MTGNGIPEGLDRGDIVRHNFIVGSAVQMINAASDYLDSEDGTPAETAAEDQLASVLHGFMESTPRDADQALIMVLVSLIVGTGDQEKVQDWFTDQQRKIQEALGG